MGELDSDDTGSPTAAREGDGSAAAREGDGSAAAREDDGSATAAREGDDPRPPIAVLPEYECWQLLQRDRPRVGRLAFVEAGWPLVLPVNYLAVGTLIYIRTAPGSKLLAAVNLQQVTFEVDDVDDASEQGWSVLAFGRLHLVTDEGELDDIRRRPLRPWARGAREHLLRMDVAVVSGRRLG